MVIDCHGAYESSRGGEESIPSVVPGLVTQAIRTYLDVFRNVGVHPGPPEVPPHKLDCHLLSEVSGHLAVVFGFGNGGYHRLGYVEASSLVVYVV